MTGNSIIGLDGVVEQQHNYRKSGFVFAWRNIRYSGEPDLDASATTIHSCDDIKVSSFGLVLG